MDLSCLAQIYISTLVYTFYIMTANLVACTNLLAPTVSDAEALPFIVKEKSTMEHFQICLLLIFSEDRFKFFHHLGRAQIFN